MHSTKGQPSIALPDASFGMTIAAAPIKHTATPFTMRELRMLGSVVSGGSSPAASMQGRVSVVNLGPAWLRGKGEDATLMRQRVLLPTDADAEPAAGGDVMWGRVRRSLGTARVTQTPRHLKARTLERHDQKT
jgi:hypothetical protein